MITSAQALVKAMGVSEMSWGKIEYMRREEDKGSKLGKRGEEEEPPEVKENSQKTQSNRKK